VTALELVYQYRQLLAKCEGSDGLTVEEIEVFSTLEQLIGAPTAVQVEAELRVGRFHDPVRIAALSRDGAACCGCPDLERGQRVELRFEDAELSLSYRFGGIVEWVRDRAEDTLAGIRFTGAPILVRSYAAPEARAASEAAA
jgi:hypothetical protein